MYTPSLSGKWCDVPLQRLLPYGLTGQVRFQTWLKQRDSFRPSTLKYKVLYVEKTFSQLNNLK